MPEPSGIAIPEFSHEGLLPPFLGDGTGHFRSPYTTSVYDLILRFGTTPRRCDILRGFVSLRHVLFLNGITGFQWVGGSFVERRLDKATEARGENSDGDGASQAYVLHEPADIDVVSFINHTMDSYQIGQLAIGYNLVVETGSKEQYSCDSYLINISSGKDRAFLIEETTYWYSLFSHTRNKIWKGMLRLPLAESSDEFGACVTLINWRQKYEPAHQAIHRI